MQEEPTTGAPEEPEAREEGEPREGFRGRYQPRLYLKLIALGLLVAYAIAFVLENNRQVSVHFVLGTARGSLIWLILVSVAIGLLAGMLLSQLYRRRRRRN